MEGAERVAAGAEALSLSAPERAVLGALRSAAGAVDEPRVAELAHLAPDASRGALQRLRSKHLVVVDETTRVARSLTPRGVAARRQGLPERRMLELLAAHHGELSPEALAGAGLEASEQAAAIGILRRRGLLEAGVPFRLRADASSAPLPEETALAALEGPNAPEVDDDLFRSLSRRGLAEEQRWTDRSWAPSPEGRALDLEAGGPAALGALTPQLLASGAWRGTPFRPYDVRADVPFLAGARPHPYAQWLEEFRELLVGLGFEESEGPLLETEFWNADVLFMPQEHPARSIQDVLWVERLQGREPPAELLARVAAVHEGRPLPGEVEPVGPGWRYPYDPAIARRPVLRSQTTAVSARYLFGRPSPPFRMFCLDRNFRRDSVDATHHVEFTQCEGVVGAEGTSLRDLVGIFRALAEGIGIRELKIRPGFFPFTEPSVEGYVRHPRLGWIEVFPGGLFRPEVLRPLGVEVPVAAWGIGVMRLAMVSLGVNDIRELFTDDLGRLTGRGT